MKKNILQDIFLILNSKLILIPLILGQPEIYDKIKKLKRVHLLLCVFDQTPVCTRTIARVLIYHKIPGANRKKGKMDRAETRRVQPRERETELWQKICGQTQPTLIRYTYNSTGAIQDPKL